MYNVPTDARVAHGDEAGMDIAIGLITAALVALLWNKPFIRPGRLLVGALTVAVGVASAVWPLVFIGAAVLVLAVNPERLRASGKAD